MNRATAAARFARGGRRGCSARERTLKARLDRAHRSAERARDDRRARRARLLRAPLEQRPGAHRPRDVGYTRFTPAKHPITGEPVHLIGLWIEHPDSPRPPNNGSHYLIRHADGTYEAADIQGMVPAVPNNQSLRAARAIAVSPFAPDAGRVFYFGGYDTAGDNDRNTAWIVRGR